MAGTRVSATVNPSPPRRGLRLPHVFTRRKPDYRPRSRIQSRNQRSRFWPNKWNNDLVSRIFSNWWLELLSMVIALATFNGTVALVRHFQDQPIPSWPAGLSINTALSVLGVVFKAQLLFIAGEGLGQLKWQWFLTKRPLDDFNSYDEASRGPWGSLLLLSKARWRNMTAFVGALITIVALGIDPFTQAVVGYYPCTVDMINANARISRVNSYFSSGIGYTTSTVVHVALSESFTNPTSLLPDYTCAESKCQFQTPYHTIGMCSACEDVTSEIVSSCDTADYPACNYTLANQLPSITPGLFINTTATRDQTRFAGGPPNSARAYNYDILALQGLGEYGRYKNGTLGFLATGDLPSYQSSTIDLVSANPLLGARCILSLCVRTYTAEIDAGVLRESLESTTRLWSNITDDDRVIGMVRVDCLNDEVRARLLTDAAIDSPTAEWMPWDGIYLNGSEAHNGISSSQNLSIPTACSYQVQIIDSIQAYRPREVFSDFMNGKISGVGWNDTVPTPDSKSVSHLLQLWNNGSISIDSIGNAFANFTTVVSNYMRTQNSPIPSILPRLPNVRRPNSVNAVQGAPGDWNHPATGTAISSTTCVHIRWQWLALPAALTLAGLIFLTALIIQNADDCGHGIWKSSQEAVLWHGLDGPVEDESVWLITTKEMQERAKKFQVRLGKGKRGWKLIEKQD